MSRYRASTGDDLAYGDIPQRWDRERFERFGSRGGPPTRQYEDDFVFEERDRPGRREITIAERRESGGPKGRWVFEEDREESRRREASRRRRRTDRELFGDVDPREIADMAMMPYRRKSITREDFDDGPPRPGLLRRQSSLDTFDRRPRNDRSDYRNPPYAPVLREDRRRHDYAPSEDYREVEITRERSVHRRRGPKSERAAKQSVQNASSSSSSASSESVVLESKKSSRAPTSVKAKSNRAPSAYESIHETYIHEDYPLAPIPVPSVHEIEESVREERKFKKGKTRMPKRLVRREAIMDLGYPFDEEDDFFVLRIALEKDQIDEVIQITEQYKEGGGKRVYKFEEKIEEDIPGAPTGETVERTEWVNPPSDIFRRGSPSAKSSISQMPRSRSRRPSSPGTYVESRRETIIEQAPSPPAPPPAPVPEYYEERKTVIEERRPDHHAQAGTLVLVERDYRSDRDINAEIRALEQERRALRYERDADQKRDLALRLRDRPDDDYQLVQYRSRSRPREELVIYERDKSPARNVVRVEKDRKGRMALVRSAH